MKKLLVVAAIIFSAIVSSNADELKKLVFTLKGTISKDAPIYVEPIDNDRCMVIEQFKGSLTANGFKVVSDRKEATNIITITYDHRSDMVCNGRVIKQLNGHIIDAKNGAAGVATFEWSQNSMQGKCAGDVMSGIAAKMNSVSK